MSELESLPTFKSLNEQQKNFVRHWVASGGDQVFSFNQTYSAPNPEIARRGSYSVVQRKSVREVLDTFLQKSEKEKFLDELERACRSRKMMTPTRLKLFQLRALTEFGCDLKALRKKEATQERADVKAPRVWAVGDRTFYHDRPVIVTGVDANGRVTDVEWVTP
jgi:hypothetical protein